MLCGHCVGQGALAHTLLPAEAERCRKAILEHIATQHLLTLSLDGWSINRIGSIYALNFITYPDRCQHFWGAVDFSADTQTAADVAGVNSLHHGRNVSRNVIRNVMSQSFDRVIQPDDPCIPEALAIEQINAIGPNRIVSVVTENAASMDVMRDIIADTDGYKHIILGRCETLLETSVP